MLFMHVICIQTLHTDPLFLSKTFLQPKGEVMGMMDFEYMKAICVKGGRTDFIE